MAQIPCMLFSYIIIALNLMSPFAPTTTDAGFTTAFLELPEGVLDGISLETWYPWVSVRENVGRDLDSGFPLVKILLESPGEVQIEQGPGERFALVPHESKMFWYLNATSYFDYEEFEMPDNPPVLIVNVTTSGPGVTRREIFVFIRDEDDVPCC